MEKISTLVDNTVLRLANYKKNSERSSKESTQRHLSKKQWEQDWEPTAWSVRIFSLFCTNYQWFAKDMEDEQNANNFVTLFVKRLIKYPEEQIYDALDEVFEIYRERYPNAMQYEQVIIDRANRKKSRSSEMFGLQKQTKSDDENKREEIQHWLKTRDMLINQPESALYQQALRELKKLGAIV